MTSRKVAQKPAGKGAATDGTFSDDERAAMKERARELKAEARATRGKADGEQDVLAAIAAMPEPDRAMATRPHAIIHASAPALTPKTWYGMPAYARDGTVVCFFQGAHKFKARYATFGFSDKATLDDGSIWPVAFALKELTPAVEATIGALLGWERGRRERVPLRAARGDCFGRRRRPVRSRLAPTPALDGGGSS